MIELLSIKVGSDYCRVGETGIQLCTMSKASVWPLPESSTVFQVFYTIRKAYPEARVVKMKIIEENYTDLDDEACSG